MKIDFYISSLSSGGAEHVLTNLAGDFAEKGHEVGVISYEKRPQFYNVSEKVNVTKYDHTKKNTVIELVSDFFLTRRHIAKSKADVAVSFLSRCNLMLVLAGVFTNTKIIVCDRNNLLMKYPKYVFIISCWLYKLADAVCVQTNEIKKTYPKFLQKKIFVLENPLDFDELEMQCKNQNLNKNNTIISVGRLEKQKDFITLIRAFERIAGDYPEWKLNIFGQGNRKNELQSLIDSLNLSKQVKLCGVTRSPFLEMKRSKIFVLSSFYEGFPNVLCEAMHAELPCISTRCACGPSELITDGENGFLVDIGDVATMSEKMSLLIDDEELRNRLGRAAEKSTERLEYKTISSKWLEMIRSI